LIRIPRNAKRRALVPVVGKSQQGYEYKWRGRGKMIRVRVHDADPSVRPTPAVPAPNARAGWVVRVSVGKRYRDASGRFYLARELNPRGPYFDEVAANETHIPLTPPAVFP
jgi:hypothetical protein